MINPEGRLDEVNAIVYRTFFLSRSFLDDLGLDLESPTIREPRKTRSGLNVVSSDNEVSFTIL